MATHSSILAWRILWTEEPGGLLSMGLHRVRYDWSDLAAAAGVSASSLVFWDIKEPRCHTQQYLTVSSKKNTQSSFSPRQWDVNSLFTEMECNKILSSYSSILSPVLFDVLWVSFPGFNYHLMLFQKGNMETYRDTQIPENWTEVTDN